MIPFTSLLLGLIFSVLLIGIGLYLIRLYKKDGTTVIDGILPSLKSNKGLVQLTKFFYAFIIGLGIIGTIGVTISGIISIIESSSMEFIANEDENNKALDSNSSFKLKENMLGNIILNSLTFENIPVIIPEFYPELSTQKRIGKQDGPDYIYFEINKQGNVLFVIKMDTYDSTKIESIWIYSNEIDDVYGVNIGDSLEDLKNKRNSLEYSANEHYSIFAYNSSSNIRYRLKGSLDIINDSMFVEMDYSVHEWQLKDNVVDYIIWKP
jgi:hypothetical protein